MHAHHYGLAWFSISLVVVVVVFDVSVAFRVYILSFQFIRSVFKAILVYEADGDCFRHVQVPMKHTHTAVLCHQGANNTDDGANNAPLFPHRVFPLNRSLFSE